MLEKRLSRVIVLVRGSSRQKIDVVTTMLRVGVGFCWKWPQAILIIRMEKVKGPCGKAENRRVCTSGPSGAYKISLICPCDELPQLGSTRTTSINQCRRIRGRQGTTHLVQRNSSQRLEREGQGIYLRWK